jgi:ElaB/YqjD/DUF883 family membrane-anchored ribosome-binding protein
MAAKHRSGGSREHRTHEENEGPAGGIASTVKDAASSVASTAEGAWDSTREGVQRAASAVADTAGDAWGEVTGLMRRHPFGTLCVGIGVGFLLARLLEDRGTREFRRLAYDLYDRVRDYASDVASKVRA